MPTNVMIVDDQNISRQLFESIVNNSPRYNLLLTLPSAKTADIYCLRYPVELVLMDVVMNDGSNGLDAAARIKKARPEIKILAVTSMPEVSFLQRAREIGVDSFWYKEAADAPLLEVMDRTMAGESVYPGETPEVELGYARSTDFTERELAVLRELTTGCSDQEIAARLNISFNTVRSHISHMLEKTGFSTRTQLAISARVSGLVIADLSRRD